MMGASSFESFEQFGIDLFKEQQALTAMIGHKLPGSGFLGKRNQFLPHRTKDITAENIPGSAGIDQFNSVIIGHQNSPDLFTLLSFSIGRWVDIKPEKIFDPVEPEGSSAVELDHTEKVLIFTRKHSADRALVFGAR